MGTDTESAIGSQLGGTAELVCTLAALQQPMVQNQSSQRPQAL